MLEIKNDDLIYALRELVKVNEEGISLFERKWFKELKKNSNGFAESMLIMGVACAKDSSTKSRDDKSGEVSQEGYDQLNALSDLWSFVYAAVYHALGKSLPVFADDDYEKVLDEDENGFGDPFDDPLYDHSQNFREGEVEPIPVSREKALSKMAKLSPNFAKTFSGLVEDRKLSGFSNYNLYPFIYALFSKFPE